MLVSHDSATKNHLLCFSISKIYNPICIKYNVPKKVCLEFGVDADMWIQAQISYHNFEADL